VGFGSLWTNPHHCSAGRGWGRLARGGAAGRFEGLGALRWAGGEWDVFSGRLAGLVFMQLPTPSHPFPSQHTPTKGGISVVACPPNHKQITYPKLRQRGVGKQNKGGDKPPQTPPPNLPPCGCGEKKHKKKKQQLSPKPTPGGVFLFWGGFLVGGGVVGGNNNSTHLGWCGLIFPTHV